REMPRLFAEVLKTVVSQQVDLLVVTGDLLDVPQWLYKPIPGFERDDVEYWSVAVAADYRLVKRLLDDSNIPYLVLPGNHDWDEIMWRVFDHGDHVRQITGRRVVRCCDHELEHNVPRRFH